MTITQTMRLSVDGMTCAACVGRVERALAAVPGVVSAQVNLATETATITTDGHTGPAALAQVLEAAGYPARLRGAPDMHSLVALGTTAAYAMSVLATFAPGPLPPGTAAV